MNKEKPVAKKSDILVVDDNLDNLKYLSELLTGSGYNVRGATDGQTALMLTNNQLPDLILLDVLMPDMDGLEVCRRLKQKPATRDVPVIFISGLGETKDIVAGFQAGGVDYIAKPFQVQEVLARVQTHLDLRSTHLDLEKSKSDLETRVEQRTAALHRSNKKLKAESVKRKRTEEDLRIKGLALASAINAIGITDLDGKLIYVNDSCVEMWGYANKEEILGRYLPEFWEGEAVFETIRMLHEQGGKIAEDVGKRKDGSLFDAQFSASMINDEAGNPLYMFGSFVDITDRKRTEEELQKNQVLLNETGRIAKVGGWEINVETQALTWTDEVYHIHEIGMDFTPTVAEAINFYAPQSRPLIREAVDKIMDDGEPFDLELQLIKAKGTLTWVHAIGKADLRDGKPIRVTGTFQDITEHKRAEDALQEQYSTLHSINESINAIIFSVDKQYRYTSFNKAHAAVMKEIYGAEIKIGHSLLDYQTVTEDREKAKRNIDRALAGEQILHEEYSGEEQRSRLFFEISTNPIRTAEGHVIGVVVLVKDITELKKAQERERKDAQRTKFLLELHAKTPTMTDKEVYDYTLEYAVNFTNSQLGYVHRLHDDQKTLSLVAWNKEALEYCEAEYDEHYPIDRAGVWADCARKKQPVVHNDYQNLPKKKGYPEGHSHLIRHLSIPVMDGEQVRMIIGVGNKETDYDETDITQLQLVANELQKIIMRRQAADALRESDEKFRSIIECLPLGMHMYQLETDGQLRFVAANPAADRILGVDNSEFVGKTIFEAFPEINKTEIPERFRIIAEKGGFWKKENIVYKDENIAGAFENYNFQTSPGIMVSLFQNITERKRAEIELKEKNQFIESIVNLTPEILYIYDIIEKKNVYSNDGIQTTLGYSAEELKEMGDQVISTLMHPDDFKIYLEETVPKYSKAKDKESIVHQYRMRHKNGRWHWLDSREIIYLRLPDGSPKQIFGVIHDISERVQADKALRESEASYRSLADSITDMFFAFDKDLRYTFWNKTSEETTGIPAKEALGKSLYDLFPYTKGSKIEQVYLEALRTQKQRTFVTEYQINGQTQFFELYCYPSSDGLSVVAKDITERKKAEESIREQARLLDLIFECSLDSIVLLDKDYNFIRVSKTYAQAGQRDIDEFPGHNHFEFYPSDFKEEADEAKRKKSIYRASARPFVFPDHPEWGVTYWDLGLVPILDGEGEVELFLFTLKDVTERKQAAEALLKWAHVFEHAGWGIVIGSADGKTMELMNPALAKMYGYTVEELTGKPNTNLLTPESRKELSGQIRLAHKKGHHTFEARHIHKDGTIFPVLVDVTAVKDETGKVLYRAVNVQDITERKRAEEALQKSETQYRQLIEQAPNGIFLMDTSGQFILANSKTCEMLGYTEKEMYKRNILDTYATPEEREKGKERLGQLEAGEILGFERTMLRKDGTVFPVAASAAKIADGNVQAIIHDITARKQAEEEIRKLSLSVEQSPASIIITDLRGHIEYVNPRFCEITGYSFDEVKGQNPRILKSGYSSVKEYEKLWKTISSGKVWRGEFHNIKKNGEFYWESAIISPIKNSKGVTTRYLAMKEDITEVRQLKQQLVQAQKMESIGTLAGGIAHDFNNILTVINGYSDMALMELDEGQPLHEDILAIRSAGEMAENLTRHILAFSRKQMFQPKIIAINQILSDLEKMIRRLIGEDINIEMCLASDLPRIKADPGQIEQILVNLVVNARDAINQKTAIASEKQITIEVGQADLDERFVAEHFGSRTGHHIFFSVSDNGIGMSDVVKEKIFEPFYTTKEKGQGTGLGLATVYGIVKQNEGSIYVYSEKDKGTTFKIYWPISGEGMSDSKTGIISDDDLRGSETILFVEDNEQVCNFACTVLRDCGYQVYAADCGNTALELVNENKFKIDLVITDMIMPNMSGEELIEKLTKILPGTRVLFTSGYTEPHLGQSGELSDNINFLPKPYSRLALLQKAREVILMPGPDKPEPT